MNKESLEENKLIPLQRDLEKLSWMGMLLVSLIFETFVIVNKLCLFGD